MSDYITDYSEYFVCQIYRSWLHVHHVLTNHMFLAKPHRFCHESSARDTKHKIFQSKYMYSIKWIKKGGLQDAMF
jgi:hypothetical protein